MRNFIETMAQILLAFRRSVVFWGSTFDRTGIINRVVVTFKTSRLRHNHLRRRRQVVLAEITQIPEQHISLLTFLDAVCELGKIQVYGFRAGHAEYDFWRALSHRLGYHIAAIKKGTRARVTKEIGFSAILVPRVGKYELESGRISRSFFLADPSRRDLEEFSVHGVQIGDLIYDAFLRQKRKVTVAPQDEEFQEYFRGALSLFLSWEKFFLTKRIDIFVGSNVYLQAIPQRIAIRMNKQVFDVQGNRVHRLTSESPSFSEFRTLVDDVEPGLIEGTAQENPIENTEQAIISGKGGFTAHIPMLSPEVNNHQAFEDGFGRLVAFVPSLRDSPHTFGLQAFPDPFQWVKFLCEFCAKYDLPLSVKAHPISPEDSDSLTPLLEQHPQVLQIQPTVSSYKVLESVPAAVLSIRGHVALEAGLRGIPVALAGRNNPYVSFGFASCALDSDEHGRQILEILSNPTPTAEIISKARRALRTIDACFPDDILIPDYHKVVSENKSRGEHWNIYTAALDTFSHQRRKQNRDLVIKFLNSYSRRLSPIYEK